LTLYETIYGAEEKKNEDLKEEEKKGQDGNKQQ